MRCSLLLTTSLFLIGAVAAQNGGSKKIDFGRDVLPIFERSCMKCHKAAYKDKRGKLRKPKAGLRLDGNGWIMRGTDDARVLVPGQPGESSLYLRTTLPADDDDLMPAAGRPLKNAEQETLRRWIAEGATFGKWVGAGGPGTPTGGDNITRFKVWQTLGEGVSPLAKDKMQARGFRLQPVMSGSPLLSVRPLARGSLPADAAKTLAPLVDRIAQVHLAGITLSADQIAVIAKMKRLTHLDLRQSKTDDAALRRLLPKLPELRYLNLFGTLVTDESVAAIGQLKHLRNVYLWKSKVSEEGVATLRTALPTAVISATLDLPRIEPPKPQQDRRRRRRKK